MYRFAENAISWTELGLVPDVAIRAGIRRLLAERLDEIHADDVERAALQLEAFIAEMRLAEIAPLPKAANEQHYELLAGFFTEALGTHRKYSSCYWPPHVHSLDEAEAEALAVTCARAEIVNGASVLDLGCGWGSLSLWIAERYPDCRVTSVSNSHSQREHIVAEASRRGLQNIEVLTCDMNDFEAPGTYDRVVSVEMLEHMRNYERLFERISAWLKPGGRFFMHIFCHRLCAYAFEDKGPSDWMSRHFFTGGFMPGVDVPLHFQRELQLQSRWIWDGRHYEKTANAWLANIDARKEAVMPILRETYGADQAARWFGRWRMFFMACAELFGYANGQEWYVAHYLFSRREDQ
jgi:cyclopropane-fatty-acyl-phospholipid synthase